MNQKNFNAWNYGNYRKAWRTSAMLFFVTFSKKSYFKIFFLATKIWKKKKKEKNKYLKENFFTFFNFQKLTNYRFLVPLLCPQRDIALWEAVEFPRDGKIRFRINWTVICMSFHFNDKTEKTCFYFGFYQSFEPNSSSHFFKKLGFLIYPILFIRTDN